MTPKAISKPESFNLLDDGQDKTCAMGGAYRLTASGGDFEVELTNVQTVWRSVVYVLAGHDLTLFLPEAAYSFYVRPLLPAADGNARLSMRRMGLVQKAGFYLNKAVGLFRRSPREWLNVGANVTKRLFSPASARTPVAARTGTEVAYITTEPQYTRTVIEPPMPDSLRMAVSIVIPTKERLDLLKACIESLGLIEAVVYEIIIVDNGATHPDMRAYLAELTLRDNVRVLRRDTPFNFSQLCNDGARLAKHPLLLFLNDDIEATDGTWLGQMCDFAARPDAGVVGARLLYPSGLLQHGGIASNLVPGPGHPWREAPQAVWQSHPLLAQAGEVDAVTAACLMIRHELFDTLGGFDESDFAITLNDVDLCLRARKTGLKIIYVPQATLLHKEGQTRTADDRPEEHSRRLAELQAFMRRHPAAARSSCFYPLNLRRDTDTGAAVKNN